MSKITPALIKELRDKTGSGMADCKKALVETDGAVEKAIEYLRKKGLAKAAKKEGRTATEGLITQYIHAGGKIGVLLETNCETDFVAKNEDFVAFTREVMLQIAAMSPTHTRPEDVPQDLVDKEREIRMAAAKQSGKPEAVIGKIVDGQIKKWLSEICLLDQKWVKDDKKSITDLQTEIVAKLGENIRIRRFARYELGEGLAKKEDNFAEEVAKQAGLS